MPPQYSAKEQDQAKAQQDLNRVLVLHRHQFLVINGRSVASDDFSHSGIFPKGPVILEPTRKPPLRLKKRNFGVLGSDFFRGITCPGLASGAALRLEKKSEARFPERTFLNPRGGFRIGS